MTETIQIGNSVLPLDFTRAVLKEMEFLGVFVEVEPNRFQKVREVTEAEAVYLNKWEKKWNKQHHR